MMNLERFVEWNLKTNGLGSWSCFCFSKEDVVGLFRRPTMKRIALDTRRASLIIVAVIVAAAQCCIPFKCKKEGEGKKTLKAFNPEIFFPAALVFHSSSEFFTKHNHHQHNKTKQVNKQANNVHKRVSSCHCNSTRGRLLQCTTQQILGKSLWNVLCISLSLATTKELGIQNTNLSLCSSSEQKP